MENKETIVTLKGVQEKEAKSGRKYISFQTSDGNMTCFESSICDELKKHLDKKVRLEIAEKDGFTNIRKFLGEISEEKISQAKAEPSQPSENFEQARKLKDQSIYTSYAKDIFLQLVQEEQKEKIMTNDEVMKQAIALVKQARDAFKEA